MLSGVGLRSAARRSGAFYTDPVNGNAAFAPGGLIRTEPMIARLAPGVAMPGKAWRILYATTSATGSPVTVSGTVLVPRGRHGRPSSLVGYAVGTQGLGQRCAASIALHAGVEYEAPVIASMLRRGWAVAVTDYPGLGTGVRHPYVVGRALGPAVLDCMRAARNLLQADLHPAVPAALYGYSEGGAAAGWAAELQPSYAPELPLRAAALGGAPSDLCISFGHLEHGRSSWLQRYGAMGLDHAYPELLLDRHLNERGRRETLRLSDSHAIWQLLDSLGRRTRSSSHFLTTSPYLQPAWQARMAENRLGTGVPEARILLTHARHDQFVGYAQAPLLRDAWRGLGVDVTFHTFRHLEHITGGAAHAITAVPWIARALAMVDKASIDYRGGRRSIA